MMPDEKNIVDGPGLDEDWAKKNFLGKTIEDASLMFRAGNNHCYTEDFTYLSDLAVRYYLPAVIEYAASDDSRGDYLFIGGIALSLGSRQNFSNETKNLAQNFARLILADLEKYDLDDDLFYLEHLEYLASE